MGWAWGINLEPYSNNPIADNEDAFKQVLKAKLVAKRSIKKWKGQLKWLQMEQFRSNELFHLGDSFNPKNCEVIKKLPKSLF